MADESRKEPPIIFVRKNHRHDGHHGGAWKVAYADFVTAMMAFFLVMWLVTQSNVIKQAIQAYFLDPAHYGKNFKASILEGGPGMIKGGAVGEGPGEEMTQKEELKKALEELGTRLQKVVNGIPGLDIPRNSFEIEMTREGLRIQLIESDDNVSFFRSGRATLSTRAELILKTIAMELKPIPNQLVIEGHTDASDLSFGEGYSNWELSTDRANAARRAMVDAGFDPGRIYNVRGYAANKPRIKDNPADPRNRRITILVLNRVPGSEEPEDSYETPIVMSKSDIQ